MFIGRQEAKKENTAVQPIDAAVVVETAVRFFVAKLFTPPGT